MESAVSRIGQAERDDGNCDGHNRRRLLRALQREGTQDEADEEAAGVSQKNCGGIEVKAQEPENRSGQGDRHHRDERGSVEQCHHEDHHGGEQSGSGG